MSTSRNKSSRPNVSLSQQAFHVALERMAHCSIRRGIKVKYLLSALSLISVAPSGAWLWSRCVWTPAFPPNRTANCPNSSGDMPDTKGIFPVFVTTARQCVDLSIFLPFLCSDFSIFLLWQSFATFSLSPLDHQFIFSIKLCTALFNIVFCCSTVLDRWNFSIIGMYSVIANSLAVCLVRPEVFSYSLGNWSMRKWSCHAKTEERISQSLGCKIVEWVSKNFCQ